MMAARTPNLGRLAAEGMRFTDYYAGPPAPPRGGLGTAALMVTPSPTSAS